MRIVKSHPKINIEYIKYLDHFCSSGWSELSSVKRNVAEGCEIESSGFVIHEDDNYVVIASTLSEDKQTTTRQYILKPTIIERKKIA